MLDLDKSGLEFLLSFKYSPLVFSENIHLAHSKRILPVLNCPSTRNPWLGILHYNFNDENSFGFLNFNLSF